MAISRNDFFVSQSGIDPWDTQGKVSEELDQRRLTALINGRDPDHSDLDVALALMDLVRDEFLLSGTSGGESTSDAEMRLAVRALERVTARTWVEFKLPFRDHSSWRAWWHRNGAYGSWQARRELLGKLFDEPYAALMSAQDRALDAALLEAVTPHARLGWNEVDTEIGELRRHFRTAVTPQDYRAIGNDCVHLTEALSRQVYNHESHTPPGEEEPSPAKTKLRLERFIEAALPSADNAELRKYARASIELAQAVKHSGTPTRTEAGILADAVIALANMLRRLDED